MKQYRELPRWIRLSVEWWGAFFVIGASSAVLAAATYTATTPHYRHTVSLGSFLVHWLSVAGGIAWILGIIGTFIIKSDN